MEFVLVHAPGEQISKYSNLKSIPANGFEDPLDLGRKIINDIGLKGKGGKPATGVITKKKWSDGTPQWLGSNKTPKTDIILGGKKVSLKKGSSQLMSGAPVSPYQHLELQWKTQKILILRVLQKK